MSPELIYFVKVNIGIALFYAFYRLFCCKDTFFHWRRLILLAFLFVSFLYPLFRFQEWVTTSEPINGLATLYAALVLPEVYVTIADAAGKTNYTVLFLNLAGWIYLCGVALLFMRFLGQLLHIWLFAFRCKKEVVNGVKVHVLTDELSPFSFFHRIFVNPQTLTDKELSEVLVHESTHARQYHSLDVIFSELACILCWVNPFMWLMKREIRYNLEYMADNKVIESGYDSKTYQYHLLGLANHKAIATIYNNFNVLPIKNRIMMMNKKRTKRLGRTKYALFIPLIALLLLFSNVEAVARMTGSLTSQASPDVQKSYTGVVTDEQGKPLQGAVVVSALHNATPGVLTDANGKFTIQAAADDILIVTCANKKAQRISLKNVEEHLTIQMKAEKGESTVNALPEVVEDEEEEPLFMVVEEMPSYPGGMKNLMDFLGSNIKYPKQAVKDRIEGRVIAQFTVRKDGTISDIVIVRSISPELDAETIRVLKLMDKWEPGVQRGKKVNVKFTIPVTFRLPEEKVDDTPSL